MISQFFQMDRLVVEGGKTVSGELDLLEGTDRANRARKSRDMEA